MPTTTEEASNILALAREYLSDADLRCLFTALDEAVGQTSTNDSLRQSLAMLRRAAEEVGAVREREWQRTWLIFRWAAIWLFHSALVGANAAAFCVAPFYAPWYLAFPACFAIIWSVCSRAECPITAWENDVRRALGWPLVRGFVGHYYVRPLRRLWRRLRRPRRAS
jgi:hypothetical protein